MVLGQRPRCREGLRHLAAFIEAGLLRGHGPSTVKIKCAIDKHPEAKVLALCRQHYRHGGSTRLAGAGLMELPQTRPTASRAAGFAAGILLRTPPVNSIFETQRRFS